MSVGYLFSGEQVDEHVKRIQQGLTADINKLTDLSGLDKAAASHGEAALIEPCTLERAAAEFDVKEDGTSVKVTLTIPVSGSTALLHTRVPRSRGENILVRGEYLQRTFWAGEPQLGPRVQIVESFPAGTSPDEVRAKAKQSVDAIEANLELINAFVEEHNASVPDRVQELAAQRRQVLETGGTLRDELGGGI